MVGRESAGRRTLVGSQWKDREHLPQSESDRRAKVDKYRDEDDADKAKIEVKNGVEICQGWK